MRLRLRGRLQKRMCFGKLSLRGKWQSRVRGQQRGWLLRMGRGRRLRFGKVCAAGGCKTVCVPKTCSVLGFECGTAGDDCGNTLDCGTCAAGKTCSNNKCVVNCVSHASKKCDSGKLYWHNSCNAKEEMAEDCGRDILTDNYRCDGNWI